MVALTILIFVAFYSLFMGDDWEAAVVLLVVALAVIAVRLLMRR